MAVSFCAALHTVNPLLSPLGAYFSHLRWGGGLKREGGLFNLVKRINGSKGSRGRTCGSRGITAFSNNKKMVTILQRELERIVEKVKQMKLEVMRQKTKNNMNFQPE